MSTFPYAGRFAVHRRLPEEGTPAGRDPRRAARPWPPRRTPTWESGKCSGTMYCGDHDHYGFLNEAFGLFAHVNVLQRDMCPSATKFEAEIIAMTLDLLHAEAVTDGEPVGLVATGGTGSICHAMLAYRDHAASTAGHHPSQRDQAGDRPSGLRQGLPPVRDRAPGGPGRSGHHPGGHRLGGRRTSTPTRWPSSARPATTATAPSTPSASCPSVALEPRGRAPRRQLPGRVHPALRPGAGLRHPGLRLPAPRGHLHVGRHPQVRLRLQGHLGAHLPGQGAPQRPVLLPHRLERRQVLLAGHGGVAVGWADRRHLGGHGPARAGPATGTTPRRSSTRPPTMQAAVRSHPELRILGRPDLPVQLHLRRVRHLPRQRLHAGDGAGGSTASSTPTPCTWR